MGISKETNFGDKRSEHKAGITLSKNNSTNLKQELETLYASWQNNSLNLYSENAKKMISTDFTWNVLVEKFDALYK